MTFVNPPRLRTERTLPQALREALRELPHAPPKATQLDALRHQLGLPALALDNGHARPALIQARRLRERRLRRTVVALVFFPIAATSVVGLVLELEQRSTRSAVTAAASGAALQLTHPQGPSVRALTPTRELTTAPENSASSAAPDSEANPVPRARAASTALASGHGEPAPRATDTESARASELDLLQRANAALRGDPALALALTAEHRQRFPAGNLSQEREAIAIKALVALGDWARARDSLARFEQTYPHSAHALELRQIVR